LKKAVNQVLESGIPLVCRKPTSEGKPENLEFVPDYDDPSKITVNLVEIDNETKEVSHRDIFGYEHKAVGVDWPRGEYHVSYEDPFRVIAGRFLARELGRPPPELLVWPGDGKTICEQIPHFILQRLKGWTGSKKNDYNFSQIRGPNIKFDLLMTHTYWGRALVKLTRKPTTLKDGRQFYTENNFEVRNWASILQQRLLALLAGEADPLWGKDLTRKIYVDSRPRPESHRAARFLELLKTVDGIFLQCFAAVPEEKWTWHKFDMFILKNLSAMIGDEFFDGNIAVEYHDVTSRFTELKRARKTFKELSNMDILENILAVKEYRRCMLPDWLGFLLPRWEYTRSYSRPIHLTYVDSVLCQTRGAGQPPDLVKMQSKRKFLSTISEAPPPLSATEEATIQAALNTLDAELPEHVFSGLDTKARITIDSNACWENTKAEGGTIDALSEIVHLGAVGAPCEVRDLFTGEVTGQLILEETTPGTYVFWSCLKHVLESNPEEIRRAALVMISEPGKARTVTKASAALKVVLNVVNKICSWPLSKIESSKSGMQRASHAWNSFKSAFTPDGKEYVFNVLQSETRKRPDGSYLVTKHYRDLWSSSTDYEEATDSMNHQVAWMISRYWMKRCGIPPILQMIVRGTCFVPRDVVFEAYGSMENYGSEWVHDSPFQKPRVVKLRQGVLMGDPLTKVTLHLVNILVRITGANYASPEFIEKIFPQESDRVRRMIRVMRHAHEPQPVDDPTGLQVESDSLPMEGEPISQEISVNTAIGLKENTAVDEKVYASQAARSGLPKEPTPELPTGFQWNLKESLRKAKGISPAIQSQGRSKTPGARTFTLENVQIRAYLEQREKLFKQAQSREAKQLEEQRIRKAVSLWKPIPERPTVVEQRPESSGSSNYLGCSLNPFKRLGIW
jgi:hypothetical protein